MRVRLADNVENITIGTQGPYRLGIGKEDFDKVAGFEDSESGTVSIRAAGINLCVAVPFFGTEFHDLDAACHTLPAGLPEAMLEHRLFLRQE